MQFYLDGYRAGDPLVEQPHPAVPERPEDLPAEVDVLIVGCGPAGLVLAAQLAAFPEIRTAVVENALVIPRESLRHDASGDYIFALNGDVVERRAVKTGASSVTLVEVASGLKEGDSVILPSDASPKPGDRVTPSL